MLLPSRHDTAGRLAAPSDGYSPEAFAGDARSSDCVTGRYDVHYFPYLYCLERDDFANQVLRDAFARSAHGNALERDARRTRHAWHVTFMSFVLVIVVGWHAGVSFVIERMYCHLSE